MTTLSKQELIEFRKKLVRAKEFSKQTGWIFLFASLEKADLSWVTDCVVTVPKDFCFTREETKKLFNDSIAHVDKLIREAHE